MPAKKKELKLWNVRHQRNFRGSMYIAAYNRSHASRLILGYLHCNGYESSDVKRMNKELRDYGSETWGNPMDGIEPEVGLWASEKPGQPIERLI